MQEQQPKVDEEILVLQELQTNFINLQRLLKDVLIAEQVKAKYKLNDFKRLALAAVQLDNNIKDYERED